MESQNVFFKMAQSLHLFVPILKQYSLNIPNLSSRHKCIICNLVLKNSKQTSCGCKACEKCIKDYLSKGPKPCPNNQPDCAPRLTMEDINQDNATNREIGNLTVNCPFESCTFSSTLKNMVEHIDKCEFREIECEKCKGKIKVKNKIQHDKDKCEMRSVNCKYCNEEMTFKDLNSVHLNPDSDKLCSKFEGICPNNCEVKVKVKLKDHLKECSNKKLECPFHSFKCNADKMIKEKLKNHLQDENLFHVTLLLDKIKYLESQEEKRNIELKTHKELILELTETNRKTSEYCLKLEKTIEELKKKNVTINQISDKNISCRNGNFIWKFTDFRRRKSEAEDGRTVSVTSDPFYTSEFGYKMCLRVYPAGDGVGKRTYLSVFFAIMKGEHDDLLSWPFKQKVTLTIFDLESGTKHHSETFKPDIKSICYQKPTEECNIASGSPRFICFSEIINNNNNDTIYCKNDTIYIKISVDQTGISRP